MAEKLKTFDWDAAIPKGKWSKLCKYADGSTWKLSRDDYEDPHKFRSALSQWCRRNGYKQRTKMIDGFMYLQMEKVDAP